MATIAELESQISALKDKLREARQANLPEPVKDYVFESDAGTVRLSELFGDKDLLFVIHNMGKSCRYCTLWADTLNPLVSALRTRAGVALCNMDSLETQAEVQALRRWHYQMVQDTDGTFSGDMGYRQIEMEGGKEQAFLHPGVSAFKKLPDGSISRLNHTAFGPGDDFCPVWPLWELAGVTDWEPAG